MHPKLDHGVMIGDLVMSTELWEMTTEMVECSINKGDFPQQTVSHYQRVADDIDIASSRITFSVILEPTQ